eukprot:13172635-Alexandrium_andersonii.AAC.1
MLVVVGPHNSMRSAARSKVWHVALIGMCSGIWAGGGRDGCPPGPCLCASSTLCGAGRCGACAQ